MNHSQVRRPRWCTRGAGGGRHVTWRLGVIVRLAPALNPLLRQRWLIPRLLFSLSLLFYSLNYVATFYSVWSCCCTCFSYLPTPLSRPMRRECRTPFGHCCTDVIFFLFLLFCNVFILKSELYFLSTRISSFFSSFTGGGMVSLFCFILTYFIILLARISFACLFLLLFCFLIFLFFQCFYTNDWYFSRWFLGHLFISFFSYCCDFYFFKDPFHSSTFVVVVVVPVSIFFTFIIIPLLFHILILIQLLNIFSLFLLCYHRSHLLFIVIIGFSS